MKFLLLIFLQIALCAASKEHMFYSLSKRADTGAQPAAESPSTDQPLAKQPAATASPKLHHHLRWITEQTAFPVRLTVDKPPLLNDSFKLSWKRLSDGKSELALLDAAPHSYVLKENATTSSLYVSKYDVQSHEQLASYEPLLVQTATGQADAKQQERNVFSFVHLKAHKVSVEKVLNKHKISCVADFLVSTAERELIEPIMKLMEKQASFKLTVQAAGKFVNPSSEDMNGRRGSKGQQQFQQQHQQHQLNQMPIAPPQEPVNYQTVQGPSAPHMTQQQMMPQQHMQPPQPYYAQPQQQPHHQPQQQQFSAPPPVIVQDANLYLHPVHSLSPQQQHELQQMTASVRSAQYQPQPQPQQPIFYQQHQPQHLAQPLQPQPRPHQQPRPQQSHPLDEAFDFLLSSAIHQQQQQHQQQKGLEASYLAVQQHQQQIFDMLQNPYFYQPHLLSQASFLGPIQPMHFKHKRDAVETDLDKLSGAVGSETIQGAGQKEAADDADFDMSRFVKVRLSLGPVTLFRPLLTNEMVSCSLDLINLDETKLDYASVVFANMSAYSVEAEAGRAAKQPKKTNKGIIHIAVDKKPVFNSPSPPQQQQQHQQQQQQSQSSDSFDDLREKIMAPITNDLNEIKSFLKNQDLHQRLQQAHQRFGELASARGLSTTEAPEQESLKSEKHIESVESAAAFVSAQSVTSVMVMAVSVLAFNLVF